MIQIASQSNGAVDDHRVVASYYIAPALLKNALSIEYNRFLQIDWCRRNNLMHASPAPIRSSHSILH